jgi:hypothetical protein
MSKRPSTANRDPSATESGDDELFLSRWARRKRAARITADVDTELAESSPQGEKLAESAPVSADPAPAGEDSQPPELTDEDMPPLDGIDENTDMSGFFSPKVTQAVKKAALRKFFHSPAFNIVDGLDDYDEDFRNFAALGDIVTSDMRSQMEREAERAREAMAKDAQESATSPPPDARAQEVEEVEEKDREDEPVEIAAEDSGAEQMAALDAGVTREPGRQAGMAGGKLRPRAEDT